MSKTSDLVYLGKEGKSFGPFSKDEVKELKTTGKFILYSWLWDGISGDWAPINPPPPPEGAQVRPSKTAPKRKIGKALRADYVLVLCHDNQNIVSGVAADVSDQSFTLESETKSTLPIFQAGHKVWVNLLDETSGQGENIRAVVSGTARRDGKWEYQMRWDKPPSLIKVP